MANIKNQIANVYYDKSRYDIASIIAPFKKEIKKVFLLSFFINLLTVMIPLFVMFLFDEKFKLSLQGDGLLNLIVLISVVCFNFLFRYERASVINFILRSIDTNICNGILEKVFKIPAKKMEKKNDAFWHSVFSDIDVIRNGLSGSYIINLFDIPFVLLFMSFIGILLGKYFFVMLFIALFYIVVIVSTGYTLGIVDDKEKLAIKERDELVSNTIRDLSSLKSLSLSDKVMYMWKDYQRGIIDNTYKRNYTLDMFLVIAFVIYCVGLVIFSLIGEHSYNLGFMSLGALVAILLLFSHSFYLINNFIKYFPQYFKFSNSTERLAQVMAEQVDAIKTEVIEDITLGNIELKNFTLEDNRNNVILKDVNFTFKDGLLYVVRAKNTFEGSLFLRSLFGGYEASSGEILFDRYDVSNLKTDSLKDYIHYASETAFVMEGTIKENLTCLVSKNSADNNFAGFMDYKEVSKLLGFDEIVKGLPNGYNTLIAPKTDLLSLEELKLLSIVRVFVGNPRVILLDQPFLGLRKKYKENIIKLLQSIAKDKIIIISTQEKELSKRLVLNIEDEKISTLTVEAFEDASKDLQNKIYGDDMDPSETHALFRRIFRKK
ncbi:MAG: ATP-binding cassette domain-containing protein [Alphaproteobacteria bacterium]|nr:ATP-binding cassette domain-containing protein [Alphaproteobacteria bacterium]MBQ8660035.1 ATP-binding cassette domain-containing protein [Alphaproteobacteria bacterium]